MTDSDVYTPPVHAGLEILYQDSFMFAFNKPSGLLSVPGRGETKRDSMSLRVQEQFPEAMLVHRLDMETSGVFLMARNRDVQGQLGRLFQERKVKKCYIAVVEGLLEPTTGEINLPLICDWPNRPRQMVDHQHGKPSSTRYRVLLHDPVHHNSRVELTPETGRSHQLRVHMQSLGHAILGDPLYASDEALNKSERLLLHAHTLAFIHPVTGIGIEISSEIPF